MRPFRVQEQDVRSAAAKPSLGDFMIRAALFTPQTPWFVAQKDAKTKCSY